MRESNQHHQRVDGQEDDVGASWIYLALAVVDAVEDEHVDISHGTNGENEDRQSMGNFELTPRAHPRVGRCGDTPVDESQQQVERGQLGKGQNEIVANFAEDRGSIFEIIVKIVQCHARGNNEDNGDDLKNRHAHQVECRGTST